MGDPLSGYREWRKPVFDIVTSHLIHRLFPSSVAPLSQPRTVTNEVTQVESGFRGSMPMDPAPPRTVVEVYRRSNKEFPVTAPSQGLMWWHEFVWGRSQPPRRKLIGGFALLVIVALAGLIFTNTLDATHPGRRTVRSLVLPAVLFYVPGLVALAAG